MSTSEKDVKELLIAAASVLADHEERLLLYTDRENQPHRVLVMDNLRKAILKITGNKQ